MALQHLKFVTGLLSTDGCFSAGRMSIAGTVTHKHTHTHTQKQSSTLNFRCSLHLVTAAKLGSWP